MITFATFSKPEEAHMLRLRLEAGGVDAVLLDENMVQMDWFFSNAIGGVRVGIAEDDLERAREILAEPPVETAPVGMPACPSCGSTDTAPDELPRRIAFLTILLAGFPFLVSKTRWRCAHCNHVWKETNKATA